MTALLRDPSSRTSSRRSRDAVHHARRPFANVAHGNNSILADRIASSSPTTSSPRAASSTPAPRNSWTSSAAFRTQAERRGRLATVRASSSMEGLQEPQGQGEGRERGRGRRAPRLREHGEAHRERADLRPSRGRRDQPLPSTPTARSTRCESARSSGATPRCLTRGRPRGDGDGAREGGSRRVREAVDSQVPVRPRAPDRGEDPHHRADRLRRGEIDLSPKSRRRSPSQPVRPRQSPHLHGEDAASLSHDPSLREAARLQVPRHDIRAAAGAASSTRWPARS